MLSCFKIYKKHIQILIILDVTSPSPQIPTSTNGTSICCGRSGNRKGEHRTGNWNRNRINRSAPPTPPSMEDKLKDFAAKLGKTPDELRAAFGKFMLAQGISLQQMHDTIEEGNQLVLKEIENIKKAIQL